MGEASRRRRERRSGGTPPDEGNGLNTPPTLQALLICERIDTMQDGVQSLFRLVDRFTIRMEVSAPPGTPIPEISVPMNYVLFARFGAGVGRFRASFRLYDPDNQQLGDTGDSWFWLQSRERGHNMQMNISMPVKKSGPYRWVAELNGEPLGELIFTVDLQQVLVEAGPPPP